MEKTKLELDMNQNWTPKEVISIAENILNDLNIKYEIIEDNDLIILNYWKKEKPE